MYDRGYGSDTINNLHTDTKTDRILFGIGIAASDLTFARNGNDLTIEVAGQSGTLTIQNWFVGASYQIGSFELANGTAVTPNIVVQGTSGDDTLVAGPYETLLGGAGNDTYVFDRGSGPTTIFDNATTTQTVTATTEQLVWSFNGFEMGQTTSYIQAEFAAEYHLNEVVITSRTPIYNYQYIVNYYDHLNGYRAVTTTSTQTVQASGGANTLQFGAGISVSDLEVKASGNDLIIGVKDPNNPNATFAQLTDKITLQDWMNPLNRIQTFQFADGTTLGVSGIVALVSSDGSDTTFTCWTGESAAATLQAGAGNDVLTGGAFNDTLIGGPGNDTLNGADGNDTLIAGSGTNVLLGGTGNDTLIGGSGTDTLDPGTGTDTMVGGAGNDTFVYGLGYGSDIINNLHTNTKTDRILFGTGIAGVRHDVYAQRQ